MICLAIDFGGKRTGLALGDTELAIATPLEVFHSPVSDTLFRQIGKVIEREGPRVLVIGFPLNMDNSEGPQATEARQRAQRLKKTFPHCQVVLVDERQTSMAADQWMSQSGLTHKQKKARRDALAAAAILQRYFNQGASDEIQTA